MTRERTILKVLVNIGDSGTETNHSMILEAMKMENKEIVAGKSGTVVRIHMKSQRYCCKNPEHSLCSNE